MISVRGDPSYQRLKNQLIASTGLAFYLDRDSELIELIQRRLSELQLRDCTSYTKLLADSVVGEAEMNILITKLTIGETSFFRDAEQFTAIRDVILPDILERKQSSKQIRIWSAGCATGAEPYSLAIMLARDMADRIAGWEIRIVATDLNRDFLTRAEEGKFRSWALRSTPDEVRRECFSQEGQTWTIHPRYKQWISFRQMNLVESELSTRRGEEFDLILCRNVMIYFSPDSNRRLIGKFYQALDDDGWLVVGSSEHNLENYKNFSGVDATGARIYQKRAAERPRPEAKPKERVQPLLLPEPKRRPMPPRPRIEAPQPAERTDMEGFRKLADSGDWQSAARYGQRLLAQDRLNPEIHFYLALIFENLGIVDEPQRSLRQALYLDRNFALAHYHLGCALRRDGQTALAARSFGNVVKVLNGIPDESPVMAGRGITAIRLKELARRHPVGSNPS